MSALLDGERYEYIGGTSRKFWEWRLFEEGESWPASSFRLQFTWGRLGTAGQSTAETFMDRRLAEWKVKVKVAEKVGKGYRRALRVNAPPSADAERLRNLQMMNEQATAIGREVLRSKPRPPAKLYKDDPRPAPKPSWPSTQPKKEPDAAPLLTGVRRVTLRD